MTEDNNILLDLVQKKLMELSGFSEMFVRTVAFEHYQKILQKLVDDYFTDPIFDELKEETKRLRQEHLNRVGK